MANYVRGETSRFDVKQLIACVANIVTQTLETVWNQFGLTRRGKHDSSITPPQPLPQPSQSVRLLSRWYSWKLSPMFHAMSGSAMSWLLDCSIHISLAVCTLKPYNTGVWLFPHIRGFGRKVCWIISICTFSFFYLKRRSAHVHQFHSLGQDQSTVAQQAEMTADNPIVVLTEGLPFDGATCHGACKCFWTSRCCF